MHGYKPHKRLLNELPSVTLIRFICFRVGLLTPCPGRLLQSCDQLNQQHNYKNHDYVNKATATAFGFDLDHLCLSKGELLQLTGKTGALVED